MLTDPITLGIAAGTSWLAVILTIGQILSHLRNYTEPTYQRYIIRILFLVPMYAICSWFSLMYRTSSLYWDTIRDCYEAWVIYNFLALCLAYVGGPGAVVVKAEGKIVYPSWILGTCCFPPLPVDGFFLRRCKQGTLQFVVLKPILAAATLFLYAAGKYEDGVWSYKEGYLYISLIYNICYTVALLSLLMFYLGTDELLAPFKPLLKLVLIKSVIFLTFWQGIVISMGCSFGEIPADDGGALQDWIVCVEMLCSACMMLFAFPSTEYKAGGTTTGLRWSAFVHAVSLQDVISDVFHQFNPHYHDYVLYSDGGPADNVKRKKFRGRDKISDKLEDPETFVKSNIQPGIKMKKGKLKQTSSADVEMGSGVHGGSHGRSGCCGLMNFRRALRITDVERRQAELLDDDSDGDEERFGVNGFDHRLNATMERNAKTASEVDVTPPMSQHGGVTITAPVNGYAASKASAQVSAAVTPRHSHSGSVVAEAPADGIQLTTPTKPEKAAAVLPLLPPPRMPATTMTPAPLLPPPPPPSSNFRAVASASNLQEGSEVGTGEVTGPSGAEGASAPAVKPILASASSPALDGQVDKASPAAPPAATSEPTTSAAQRVSSSGATPEISADNPFANTNPFRSSVKVPSLAPPPRAASSSPSTLPLLPPPPSYASKK